MGGLDLGMEPTPDNVKNHLAGYLAVIGAMKIVPREGGMACVEPSEIADVLPEDEYRRLVEERVRPRMPTSPDQMTYFHQVVGIGHELVEMEYRRRRIAAES